MHKATQTPHLGPPRFWPAPIKQGGGEKREGKRALAEAQSLKRLITPPAAAEGVGEQARASGLTAESNDAHAAGITFIYLTACANAVDPGTGERRYHVLEEKAEASGLTAESIEPAATTTPANGRQVDAHVPEPAEWAFRRQLAAMGAGERP